MDLPEVRALISHHANVGKQVRIKLKRFLSKLPIPECIETIILNYVGMQPFPFYKCIHLKSGKVIRLSSK